MIPNELVMLEAAVLIGLQVRDYKTTLDGFKHGAKEVGPPGSALDVSKSLIKRLGLNNGVILAKLGVLIAVVAMAWTYTWSPSQWIPAVLGAGIVYYGWIIVNNIRVKQKLKKT